MCTFIIREYMSYNYFKHFLSIVTHMSVLIIIVIPKVTRKIVLKNKSELKHAHE